MLMVVGLQLKLSLSNQTKRFSFHRINLKTKANTKKQSNKHFLELTKFAPVPFGTGRLNTSEFIARYKLQRVLPLLCSEVSKFNNSYSTGTALPSMKSLPLVNLTFLPLSKAFFMIGSAFSGFQSDKE